MTSVPQWRVVFAPRPDAPFEDSAWGVVVEHVSYQEAVVEAGRRLVAGQSGVAANRLYWGVELIERLST